MNGRKPSILSAPHPPSRLLFDACHLGVVLRALALVEAPLALAVLFGAPGLEEGLGRFAVLTSAAMPPTLLWLLASCALKHWLDRQTATVQWGFAVLWGWACALLGLALYGWLGVAGPSLPASVWLAGSLSGIGLALLLTSLFVLRQRASQPAATVARLAELQSRIRPHFLFNTLNSAIALVRDNPPLAERMLEDLSDLFRHALKDAASISNLAKEIEIARQYLRIESIRFDERLRVTWTVDEDALQASVPPLLLQPLVENAIKHGIEPSSEGGEIHVLVRRKGARVLVRISNTVPSSRALGEAAAKAGNGIALNNVRARLRLMHDVNAEFRTAVRAGRYEVAFSLPAQPLLGRDAALAA
ncbi:sensor histidine kinase [Allofranklinella schreckenbergeri]|uniref:Sensor histidine kinase n=1 Tax=Allofranklinella schreckenbergeri TaxID=1076744 RepID=A0A3M6QIJ7_9BURK|nr:sensor histidine kinase [Allofranklinella schreckenbergeri]RMX02904.1 sensor histidine kinase [Allofranklinella schreckenbergeri]